MEIEQNVWGFTAEGEAIVLYTMRAANGASVSLTNIGASVVSIVVPDCGGALADVALGYKSPESYINDAPAMGKSVGRYANRIARGIFTLDGAEYRLAQNNGPNHLHGGVGGFSNRLWESRVEVNRVVFSLLSADGDQGYPGQMSVEAIYDWDDQMTLEVTYLARSSADTIVNLTNHTYFNLAGHDSGSILGHELQLNAAKYLPADHTLIPTGILADVAGTPMDFRVAKALGRDLESDFDALRYASGYDSCWAVDGWSAEHADRMLAVGVLSDAVSGRIMRISSTQPGVQVYTGNYLQGSPMNKTGGYYDNRAGVAIECQNFPDAPNKPQFPSSKLEAEQIYSQRITYKFSVM